MKIKRKKFFSLEDYLGVCEICESILKNGTITQDKAELTLVNLNRNFP